MIDSIVNLSSLSALLAFAGQNFYGATKGAVKQFSEGLSEELLDTNVVVTTVFPSNISTNISGNSGVAMIDAGGRKVRATTPEQTAREILAGIEKGSFRVLIGSDARLLDRLSRLAPKRAALIIAKQMKSVMCSRRHSDVEPVRTSAATPDSRTTVRALQPAHHRRTPV